MRRLQGTERMVVFSRPRINQRFPILLCMSLFRLAGQLVTFASARTALVAARRGGLGDGT